MRRTAAVSSSPGGPGSIYPDPNRGTDDAVLEELMDGSRILVFCASKRRCDEVTRALRQDSWPALAIHGDKSQEERDWVLQQFKQQAAEAEHLALALLRHGHHDGLRARALAL